MTFTIKIPQSFWRSILSPFPLYMHTIFTNCMNSGKDMSCFILLNSLINDFSKSAPATLGLNTSFINPRGSLVLFFFRDFKIFRSLSESQGLDLFRAANLNLLSHSSSFNISSSFRSSLMGLWRNLCLKVSKYNFFNSLWEEMILLSTLFLARGSCFKCLGEIFLFKPHIPFILAVSIRFC